MSRLTSWRVLKRYAVYSGYDYAEGRPRTLTGAAWQQLALGGRVEDNGDCLAVYDRAELVYEIWETAREIAA